MTQQRQRTSPGARIAGVVGELLITAGIIVLLFFGWQLWIGDRIIGAQKTADAEAVSQAWQDEWTAEGSPGIDTSADEVPVPSPVAEGETVGVMHVPRFGSEWQFEIAEGISKAGILDDGRIGHYPDTALPGDIGNTAYAAHRWTSGAPFDPIDTLVVGDPIVIETTDGWYTYRFRTLEYVQASQVDVLAPVPQQAGVEPQQRLLTLTSCAPKLNMLERIIAYAVFDEFTPRGDGPPSSLTEAAP